MSFTLTLQTFGSSGGGDSRENLRLKRKVLMSEVLERRQLDEDSKKLLETEAANLASYYSQLAEDKTVNPKLREAALLYSIAEENGVVWRVLGG